MSEPTTAQVGAPTGTDPDVDGGRPLVEPTGNQSVDGALERLREVGELPLGEQVAVFEAVHAALQDGLQDGRQDGLPEPRG
jgi:hypothetical protein